MARIYTAWVIAFVKNLSIGWDFTNINPPRDPVGKLPFSALKYAPIWSAATGR